MEVSEKSDSFIFTVCQAGAELALKKEIVQRYSEFHPAFSRPGFITFKKAQTGELSPDFELQLVFARAYGLSDCKGSLQDFGARLALFQSWALKSGRGKLRLHFLERDFHPVGEEPKGFVIGERARKAKLDFLSLIPEEKRDLFFEEEKAQLGDWVLDFIVVEEAEIWMGHHIHTSFHSPFPGGRPTGIVVPPEAPSRAYLKLEEALLWSGAPLQAGDCAVEIGSAPGGSCLALLRRGLEVVGIDPGEMDPVISQDPKFTFIQKTVASVLREDLPENVHWLLLDMNVVPSVSLFSVDRLASRMKDSLLGVLLTVKINQWKWADQIPSMLEHIQAMGMQKVRATQLSSNGQEIFIYGLTRKGQMLVQSTR